MGLKKDLIIKLGDFMQSKETKIKEFYRKNFVSKDYYRFNRVLFRIIIQGLGISNFQSEEVSGELNFLTKYLSSIEKPVVFDVGAHVGKYSRMCVNINSNAVIYAFEPNPNSFKYLEKSFSQENILIQSFGFHDEEIETLIFDSAQYDGSQHASIYKDVIEGLHKYNDCVESKIKLKKLDDFVEENNIDYIHLLKIDTEGNEFSVLKGAEKVLKDNKINCIQIELNEMNIISRTFFKDFIDLLEGYEFYRLLPDGAIKIYYSPLLFEIFAFQNVIAVKKGHEIKGITY